MDSFIKKHLDNFTEKNHILPPPPPTRDESSSDSIVFGNCIYHGNANCAMNYNYKKFAYNHIFLEKGLQAAGSRDIFYVLNKLINSAYNRP